MTGCYYLEVYAWLVVAWLVVGPLFSGDMLTHFKIWQYWGFRGLSEPEFYVDLVYKLMKIVGSNNFSAQFIKIISHHKKIGNNINL